MLISFLTARHASEHYSRVRRELHDGQDAQSVNTAGYISRPMCTLDKVEHGPLEVLRLPMKQTAPISHHGIMCKCCVYQSVSKRSFFCAEDV